jgi:drug/metabolite transporter (DMT)-like permease
MGLLALLTVYIVWGSTYLAIRFALEAYPPLFFPALRFIFAGGVLIAFTRLRGAALPTPKQWGNAALLAFMLLIVGNGCVVWAEQTVGSGLAATAVATVPLWTALFGMFWGEAPTRMQWAGLVVGFLGIVVLNLRSDLSGNLTAALLLVASAVSWSYGSLLGKRIDLPKGLMNPGAQMFCGGLMFLPLSALMGEHWVLVPSIQGALWVLYLAVLGSIVAFSAFVYLMSNTNVALATSYSYVNPVIAVLLGIGFGGESFTRDTLIAMALVVAGVALILAFTPRNGR